MLLILHSMPFKLSNEITHCLLEILEILLVKEYLSMRKPRFDPFLKRVHNVYFLTCSQEHKWYLAILKHIQDLIQNYLFGLLDVKINVLQDK